MSVTITSLTPTVDEFLAWLLVLSSVSGSNDVCLENREHLVKTFGPEAEVILGLVKSEDAWSNLWADARDVRVLLQERGLGQSEILQAQHRRSLRKAATEALKIVAQVHREGGPCTVSALTRRPSVTKKLLNLLVDLGELETYRPPRKRSDWYRPSSEAQR